MATMTRITVSLSVREAHCAVLAAAARHLLARKREQSDAHGFEGIGWNEHIEGACGEMAVAKAFGVFWSPTVDVFKGPDLGARIQVRTRSKHEYDLLVRRDDDEEAIFIHVTGLAPGPYIVHGWLYGHEAKHDQWLQAHGGREPAFFVPADYLRPMETCPDIRIP